MKIYMVARSGRDETIMDQVKGVFLKKEDAINFYESMINTDYEIEEFDVIEGN